MGVSSLESLAQFSAVFSKASLSHFVRPLQGCAFLSCLAQANWEELAARAAERIGQERLSRSEKTEAYFLWAYALWRDMDPERLFQLGSHLLSGSTPGRRTALGECHDRALAQLCFRLSGAEGLAVGGALANRGSWVELLHTAAQVAGPHKKGLETHCFSLGLALLQGEPGASWPEAGRLAAVLLLRDLALDCEDWEHAAAFQTVAGEMGTLCADVFALQAQAFAALGQWGEAQEAAAAWGRLAEDPSEARLFEALMWGALSEPRRGLEVLGAEGACRTPLGDSLHDAVVHWLSAKAFEQKGFARDWALWRDSHRRLWMVEKTLKQGCPALFFELHQQLGDFKTVPHVGRLCPRG